jgi:hypothetical protein
MVIQGYNRNIDEGVEGCECTMHQGAMNRQVVRGASKEYNTQ